MYQTFSILFFLQKNKATSDGKIRGSSVESRTINQYIDSIRFKILKLQERFIDEGKTISALAIKNRYLGKDSVNKMLIELCKDY